jgi:hypothetical protein
MRNVTADLEFKTTFIPSALYVMAGLSPDTPYEERAKALRPSVTSLRDTTFGTVYSTEHKVETLRVKLKHLRDERARVVGREFVTSDAFSLTAWLDGTYHSTGGPLNV